MGECIEREAAAQILRKEAANHYPTPFHVGLLAAARVIDAIPAADVLPRDEAIKMGAELAAMHGSDATSQQLEEAYLKGVEDGMTRRDVRPVNRGRWKLATYSGKFGSAKEKWYDQFFDGAFWYCDQCRERARKSNFCPNCGADMREVET